MKAKLKKKAKRVEDLILESSPAGDGPKRVKSLSELEAELVPTMIVPLKAGRKVCEVEVRRLTPMETAKLEEILDEARPPFKDEDDGKGNKKPVLDLSNAVYLATLKVKQREARAMALWWSCPIFKQAYPYQDPFEKPDRAKITEFVQGKLTEGLLEQLYSVARSLDQELEAMVNFTLPPDRV